MAGEFGGDAFLQQLSGEGLDALAGRDLLPDRGHEQGGLVGQAVSGELTAQLYVGVLKYAWWHGSWKAQKADGITLLGSHRARSGRRPGAARSSAASGVVPAGPFGTDIVGEGGLRTGADTGAQQAPYTGVRISACS
ncbi:hypothetical protein [Streptomyces cinerochromogenes]|uniref:hypothetical protein n=1 Tax=Streptomyces cinerochromogenes TaxID=66422 RepID=UPI0033B68C47